MILVILWKQGSINMRTSAYKFSFNKGDLKGDLALQDIRATITKFNKLNISQYSWRTGTETPIRYRVCVKARLGKGNPLAYKYKGVGVVCVAMADARYYDVYVQTR